MISDKGGRVSRCHSVSQEEVSAALVDWEHVETSETHMKCRKVMVVAPRAHERTITCLPTALHVRIENDRFKSDS